MRRAPFLAVLCFLPCCGAEKGNLVPQPDHDASLEGSAGQGGQAGADASAGAAGQAGAGGSSGTAGTAGLGGSAGSAGVEAGLDAPKDVAADIDTDVKLDAPVDVTPDVQDAGLAPTTCYDIGLSDPDSVHALAKAGNYLYVATFSLNTDDKVLVVDVSNPHDPKPMGQIALPQADNLHDMTYWNGFVFTGHRWGGIAWIDVTAPQSPSLVDYNAGADYLFRGLQVAQGYLFYAVHATMCDPDGGTCNNGGLSIYDVTNKAAGSTLTGSVTGVDTDGGDLGFDGNELVVDSDGIWAYVRSTQTKSIIVLDVHDRYHPKRVYTIDNVPTEDFATSDNSLALYGPSEEYLLVGVGTKGLAIYDLGNKTSAPTLKGLYPAFPAGTLALERSRKMLVATGSTTTRNCSDQLFVFDLTNIESSTFNLSALHTIKNNKMKWVITEGEYIYGAGNIECDINCSAICPEYPDAGIPYPYSDLNTGVNIGQLCIQKY